MTAYPDLKILDFSRLLPGPYCTWLLSEMGAQVTRIENPREIAKQAKVFGWDRLDAVGRARMRAQDMLARNKQSLRLDIGHARAREVVRRLVAGMDVVVEDYRPGVLARLGLGHDDLAEVNPRLVTCSITLCGQTGPYRERAGHDPLALAVSGAMSRAGDRAERPSSLGLAAADVLTGTNAALAVTAALAERARTGTGRHLDIAMSDTAMCLNANVIARHPDPDDIPARGKRRVDCGIWETKDGGFIATSDMEPAYWERFCRLAGRPDWVPLQIDPAARDGIAEEIAALFRTRTRAEWETVLAEAGTQFAPVLSVAEAFEDPHNRARGMVREVAAGGEAIRQLSLPLGPGLARDGTDRAAVLPGTDRDAVLGAAGMTEAEIAELEAEGVFG
ncbi:CaiB/BaiF CoA-transferase family protein [Psychromarinibacter sp. C21-152]|uniref:CaiB/BaiF CoA-transferase family protein n=1 Tax=Psychromarinibacter sediminicola TaxID=3033385 RepID=A0AAE3NNN5_9RHOB|nr:CaiB/BaiF CoA-transferase family protein [Psychromarinibacter sediminicola]MDF0599291.1 CaiB/BaiF CoA-transferase family protein [Psychromarinibacter sediminicola]